MLNLKELTTAIKTEANRLGFNHVGIAPALPAPHYDAFLQWVDEGNNADMGYLAREDTTAKRGDPSLILEGCQRLICLALPYARPKTSAADCTPGKGRISAYAVNRDYHEVIWDRLGQLEDFINAHAGDYVKTKSYVDTGPILERSYASKAGLGIAGKNSCLIIKGFGSYFFLAEILINLPLPIDQAFTRDLCGTCQRCIEACPTSCIREDYTIDAGNCISYLTIENKDIIPDHLKPLVENWVFGCDVCQTVCPHNAWTPEQYLVLGEPRLPECLDLIELFTLDEDQFKSRFQETPLLRAKRAGLLRNAAIVLGNQKFQPALPILQNALEKEKDSALLDACSWAIWQIEETK
jgi:epoxyqueuosine reductase